MENSWKFYENINSKNLDHLFNMVKLLCWKFYKMMQKIFQKKHFTKHITLYFSSE